MSEPRASGSRCVALAACQRCRPPRTTRPRRRPRAAARAARSDRRLALALRTEEQGTSRVEDEHWRLRPDPAQPTRLVGRYVRTVEVRSLDRVPFQCNQRPWYRQRAVYDVTVELDGDRLRVHETGYATEPSPCDHGFRHVGDYTADARRRSARAALGRRHADAVAARRQAARQLPEAPWPASVRPRPGRGAGTRPSYDDDGNLRDESEWWEITRRTDTRLDATYRRRVTVRSPDGTPIACAGAPTLDVRRRLRARRPARRGALALSRARRRARRSSVPARDAEAQPRRGDRRADRRLPRARVARQAPPGPLPARRASRPSST